VRAIEHFERCGFDVDVVLPEWAYHGRSGSTANEVQQSYLLLPYMMAGKVHFSPSGVDDDEFILQVALEREAKVVLTNDLYRDHRKSGRVEQSWLDTHCLGYMFAGFENDFFVLPRTKRAGVLQVLSEALSEAHEPLVPPSCQSIVIDGQDVARWHSMHRLDDSSRSTFSARPIVTAIEHFQSRGHTVHCVVPQWAIYGRKVLKNEAFDTSSDDELETSSHASSTAFDEAELLKPYLAKQISISPSGHSSHKLLLQVAHRKHASVVSNAMFLEEVGDGTTSPDWLEAYRIRYRFSDDGTLLPCTSSGHRPNEAVDVCPAQQPTSVLAKRPRED
jgi:hypothetical protein